MSLESVVAVFTAGVLELWLAIPLGLALGLNPVIIALASMAGSMVAVLVVTLTGNNLRSRIFKWRYKDKEIPNHRWYPIWNKYGVIGLGLTSPLIFGAPLGTAVGLALGAEKKPLIIWMSLGILIWSLGLTWAGFMGMLNLQSFNTLT
ncbi:MAG: small multi-drug export protein [Methanobacteriaceae archaeon]